MAREYYFIFYSALAVILLMGVQTAGKGRWRETSLSLQPSKGILGFCAVGIMLHHMSQTIYFANEDPGILLFMVDIGVCFVGMFFFFSGYGLYSSLRDKPDYLKNFLKKRLPAILIPFYLCNFVFILGSYIGGYRFEEGELLPYLTGWILMNSQMWYIVEIFILYLLFYAVFSLIKNKDAACIVYGVAIVAMIVVSLLLGHDTTTKSQGMWFHGEWWYNATLLLWVGILFARWEKQILSFIRKFYVLVLIPCLGFTAFLYNRTMYMLQNKGYWYEWDGYAGYKEKFQTLGVQLPFIILTVLTVVVVLQKLEFGNKILKFLGSIAMELYLIHNLFILYLPIRNRVFFIIGVYAASIALATLLHLIDRKLLSLLQRNEK